MKLFGDTSVLLLLIYVISICSDFLMSTEDGLNTANILTHCQIKNMFPKRVKVSLSCLSLDFQPQNVKKIQTCKNIQSQQRKTPSRFESRGNVVPPDPGLLSLPVLDSNK